MWNVIFNHKTFFYILFIQTKINEQTKHNKTVVKIMKVHSLPVGMWNSKSCQFHAISCNFMHVYKNINFWLETSLSWISSYNTFWASLDQFSGRHRSRDLWRQIGPIRRQDSLQSYNKAYYSPALIPTVGYRNAFVCPSVRHSVRHSVRNTSCLNLFNDLH